MGWADRIKGYNAALHVHSHLSQWNRCGPTALTPPLHHRIWTPSTFQRAGGGGAMTPPVCQWCAGSCFLSRWSEVFGPSGATVGQSSRAERELWDTTSRLFSPKLCGTMALYFFLFLSLSQVFTSLQAKERKYLLIFLKNTKREKKEQCNAVWLHRIPHESEGWNLIACFRFYLHFWHCLRHFEMCYVFGLIVFFIYI